ncbi:unnamed protein product, partial [Mesorhabditis belari]|uniref:alpha-1,2-Mannosidase n=1 Tax=Mesorhabditis belari TaxID=2138241 RepID=A0AAF3J5Y0_9BILA
MLRYKEKVRKMFYHAYNGYLDFAFPFDELKPISCAGHDTWGSFSLTLIDALDTLLVMGNATEFRRAVDLVLATVNPEANVNVSVFETNIRVVGGLLTAHMLAGRVEGMPLEPGWPCSGPLLRLAERMAERLLPAFNTDTGMPFGTVNLKYGVHKTETPITCTAGVGTFLLEFGALSRLTGDPQYEKAALRALDALWKSRSPIGLVGNHINVQTAVWTATDAGIGAGVDSYFEYLVKGALLFQRPHLMKQFYEFEDSINRNVRHGDWFHWVSMTKGVTSLPIYQSLEAFWPGLLTLVGKVDDASRIMLQYSTLLRRYGIPPEFYHLTDQEPVNGRAAYPLRPEMAESLMYLYRATDDPHWLELAAQMVDAIESSAKTRCGYATVNKVQDHSIEDRMESFFLAETTKYLYLIFDPENFLHNDGSYSREIETTNGPCIVEAGGYIYNTEAHPLDPSIIHCCSAKKQAEREALNKFSSNIDFVSLLHFDEIMLNREEMRRKEDLDLVGEKKRTEKSEYIKQQYGSEELEFEVDPSFIQKRKPTLQEIFDQAEIKDFIRKARLMDEDSQKKKNEKGIVVNLAETIRVTLEEIANETTHLDDEKIDWSIISKMVLQKSEAVKVRVIQTKVTNACVLLDQIGYSAIWRRFLSTIYEHHIYPKYRIPFTQGPACFAGEEPREADNYQTKHPDNKHRIYPGDLDLSISQFSLGRPYVSMESEGFEFLTAPIPGFRSKFYGLGFTSAANFSIKA